MHHVIIGASAAGLAALEAIRSVDRACQVTVVSKEPAPLYSRVGLTHFLDGTVTVAGMNTYDQAYFDRMGARLRAGVAAVGVDPEARTVRLADGTALPYDRLLVASGSSAVIPPIPGVDLQGVHACITREDALAIDHALGAAREVVVVGAGLIGIQAADAAAKRGKHVTVVEQMPHLMPAMADPPAARLFESLLRERGHGVRTGARAMEIIGARGEVTGVRLDAGEVVPCQLCVLAVGVRPNLEFLEGSAVQRKQGLLVDDYQRTGLPQVYAAGDAAETTDMLSRERVVMAIWPEALNQGRVAGLNMAGVTTAYEGSLAMNTTAVLGLPIASLGLWQATDTADYRIHSEMHEAAREYRKLVFQDHTLVGAVLVGAGMNAEAGILHNFIRTRQSFTLTRERLMARPVSWGRILRDNQLAGAMTAPRPSGARPARAVGGGRGRVAMKIEVALYATLSKYLPSGAQNRKAILDVQDGATVDEVLRRLGIPREHPNILLVNGKQASEATPLQDGQTLAVFPPIAGGRVLGPPTLSYNREKRCRRAGDDSSPHR